MNGQFNLPPGGGHGGGNGGPPGQDMLGIVLASLAAILGTPYLFGFIGPAIRDLVASAYDSPGFAELMYYASFALSGVAIFAVCRMALWYAIAGTVGFVAVRWGGSALPALGL